MRNKTKKSKPTELDNLKRLQTLSLKRKKLQQDIQVLDYEIGEISPLEDTHYDRLDKLRKELLFTRSALLVSAIIIALLLNSKSGNKTYSQPIGFQR